MKATHRTMIALVPFFFSLALGHHQTTTPATTGAEDPSLAQFEEQFVNSLPYNPAVNETTLRLVGFKRVVLPPDEVAEFESAWNDPPAEWRRSEPGTAVRARHEEHFWYDRAKREVRIYFPVEGALLSRRGNAARGSMLLEADSMGQIEDVDDVVKRDVDAPGRDRAVLGRRVTDHVSGVDGNVIRDGIIYLAEPALPVRHLDARTTIYDFGIRSLDHSHGGHGSHVSKRDKKKGCLANHKGVNCSKAYKISQGRCTMDPNTCMDYNGFKTDCKKGSTHWHGIPTLSKTVKFVGSDCSVSMARGHCWNEVM